MNDTKQQVTDDIIAEIEAHDLDKGLVIKAILESIEDAEDFEAIIEWIQNM